MLKRKTYIEFVRIIACFLVIIVHTHFYNNNLSIKLITGRCGVSLFLIITGYIFFSKSHNYSDLLKKIITKYIIPIFILVTFSVIFSDYILGYKTLFSCLKFINIKGLFQSYLSILLLQFWDYKNILGHLWYFKVYLFIMILYPIFAPILSKDNDKAGNICRRLLILISAIYIFILDINTLYELNISNFFIFFNEIIIYILIGYEIYLYKDILITKKSESIIFSLGLTILGLLLRKCIYGINPEFYWSSRDNIPTIIYSIGLFILLANIGMFFNQNKKINYIADKTYGIYLIHLIIIKKTQTTKFYKNLSIDVMHFSWLKQFVLEIIYSIFIFIICLIIIIIIKKIINLLKDLFIHKKPV